MLTVWSLNTLSFHWYLRASCHCILNFELTFVWDREILNTVDAIGAQQVDGQIDLVNFDDFEAYREHRLEEVSTFSTPRRFDQWRIPQDKRPAGWQADPPPFDGKFLGCPLLMTSCPLRGSFAANRVAAFPFVPRGQCTCNISNV